MTDRLSKLQARLETAGLTHFLTRHNPHVRYLTGFTGSNGFLLVGRDSARLVTDGRYTEQAALEVKGAEVIVAVSSNLTLRTFVEKNAIASGGRIGFESSLLDFKTYDFLSRQWPGVTWVPLDEMVEPLLMVKDRGEIASLRKAIAVTENVLEAILKEIKTGVTESEIAGRLGYLIRKLGGEKESFETIVASGWRGALPHGRPSDKKLEKGDFIILDFGAVVDGYHADMTRTVCLGSPSDDQRRVYDIVHEALRRATAATKAGVRAHDIDEAARAYITSEGFGPLFNHGLGHGIGLDIHEAPRIGQHIDYRVEVNNVFTIEPGIYLPGQFGVRIENDVLVTATGCDNLMTSTSELVCLPA